MFLRFELEKSHSKKVQFSYSLAGKQLAVKSVF